MKVIRQKVTFGELKNGDAFKVSYDGNQVFIKIENYHIPDVTRTFNVVDLGNGELHHLDNEAIIIPVDCTVIYN